MLMIDVDSREFAKGVAGLLARMPDIGVRESLLDAGDYALGRRIGVERKKLFDLAESIISGRLFKQMDGMRRRYMRPMLVVEGLVAGRSAFRLGWDSIRGALVSVSASFGVPVLPSTGPVETAAIIGTAVRQMVSPVTYGYARPGFRPTGWRRRALYILQGLAGIGPVRAVALLDRFGSVQSTMSAATEELQGVRGIGQRVAQSIRTAVATDPGIGNCERI